VVKFGGTVAAIAFAYQHDEDVRAHFVPKARPQRPRTTGHNTQDALPAALALGGTWSRHAWPAIRTAAARTGTMFEAACSARSQPSS